ncbi:MAG: bifunctional riboflavin kinase/FAD synthetase [FCB group bacterium]|nr:bifunctional riboflavin kinase/FAD synthetase [FCB group bacterium]
MVIYRSLKEITPLKASVLTIGTFDGVHLGHQTIFREVQAYSQKNRVPSVAITFEPHPQHITKSAGQKKKRLLTGIPDKIVRIEKAGIEHLLIIPFDEDFSKQTAREFLRDVIIENFHPTQIIVGYDHHFGCKREGNSEFLEKQARQYQYELSVVGPVKKGDQIISSSIIRKLLLDHRIELANDYLGYPFSLTGTITRGLSRGRTLGYPTANVSPLQEDLLIPADGVYCVAAAMEDKRYQGICNIGYRPTFGDTGYKTIEVHLLAGKLPDLYGKELEVAFQRFIREEIKFDGTDLLTRQIQSDIEFCENSIKGQ